MLEAEFDAANEDKKVPNELEENLHSLVTNIGAFFSEFLNPSEL